MTEALKEAVINLQNNRITNNIRIFLQKPSQLPLLQAADYVLWSVFQVFEHKEFRYYDFLMDKIKSVYDIFDEKTPSGTFYDENNPLEAKKIES